MLLSGCTLVRFHVLFKMVFAAELFLTDLTRIWLLAAVNLLVPGQLFVACESFLAVRVVTGERPLPGVRSNVVLELPVVRKTRIALSHCANKLFGSVLFEVLHRVRFFDVRHQDIGGQVVQIGKLAVLQQGGRDRLRQSGRQR